MSSLAEERLQQMRDEGKITPEQHAQLLAATRETAPGGEAGRSEAAGHGEASAEVQRECVESSRRQTKMRKELRKYLVLLILDILMVIVDLIFLHLVTMVIWGVLGIVCFFILLFDFNKLSEERRLLALLEKGEITPAAYRECLELKAAAR